MEAVELASIRNKAWPLGLELFPDGPFADLRMAMRAGVFDTLLQ